MGPPDNYLLLHCTSLTEHAVQCFITRVVSTIVQLNLKSPKYHHPKRHPQWPMFPHTPHTSRRWRRRCRVTTTITTTHSQCPHRSTFSTSTTTITRSRRRPTPRCILPTPSQHPHHRPRRPPRRRTRRRHRTAQPTNNQTAQPITAGTRRRRPPLLDHRSDRNSLPGGVRRQHDRSAAAWQSRGAAERQRCQCGRVRRVITFAWRGVHDDDAV